MKHVLFIVEFRNKNSVYVCTYFKDKILIELINPVVCNSGRNCFIDLTNVKQCHITYLMHTTRLLQYDMLLILELLLT